MRLGLICIRVWIWLCMYLCSEPLAFSVVSKVELEWSKIQNLQMQPNVSCLIFSFTPSLCIIWIITIIIRFRFILYCPQKRTFVFTDCTSTHNTHIFPNNTNIHIHQQKYQCTWYTHPAPNIHVQYKVGCAVKWKCLGLPENQHALSEEFIVFSDYDQQVSGLYLSRTIHSSAVHCSFFLVSLGCANMTRYILFFI